MHRGPTLCCPTVGADDRLWISPIRATVNRGGKVSAALLLARTPQDRAEAFAWPLVLTMGDNAAPSRPSRLLEAMAADVCRALDLGNMRSSLALLDEDEKGVHTVDTPGAWVRVPRRCYPHTLRKSQ